MTMPGRSSHSDKYRYGFNGKEKDNDLHGQTVYDYGFRIYNPALGKFLSVDPLTKSYPWYTPYQFAGNMPIWAIDLDGLEEKKVTHHLVKYADGTFYVIKTDVDIDLNVYVSVRDRNTGKEIEQLAKIIVTYEYLGEYYEGEIVWEDRMHKGLKASAAYNYMDDEGTGPTSMKQKYKDDVDSAPFWGEMYNPANFAHSARIIKRDIKAPDNAQTLQDLEILDVVVDIIEKRLKAKIPNISPSPKLGNKVDRYENPGHHDPSSPKFNKTKSILPSHHKELYGKSVLGKDGNKWAVEGTGKKKVYHRFQNDGNGNWHWNGSTNSKRKDGTDNAINMNNVPIDIKGL